MKHRFIENNSNITVEWSEIVNSVDVALNHNQLAMAGDNTTNTIESHYNTWILKDYNLPQSYQMAEYLQLNNTPHNFALYLSWSSQCSSHGKHNDENDVYIWQLQGKTLWTVYDDITSEYILSPGDILYVPKLMYHNTHSLTARASISIEVTP